jgi:hypothetical protein
MAIGVFNNLNNLHLSSTKAPTCLVIDTSLNYFKYLNDRKSPERWVHCKIATLDTFKKGEITLLKTKLMEMNYFENLDLTKLEEKFKKGELNRIYFNCASIDISIKEKSESIQLIRNLFKFAQPLQQTNDKINIAFPPLKTEDSTLRSNLNSLIFATISVAREYSYISKKRKEKPNNFFGEQVIKFVYQKKQPPLIPTHISPPPSRKGLSPPSNRKGKAKEVVKNWRKSTSFYIPSSEITTPVGSQESSFTPGSQTWTHLTSTKPESK